VTLEEKGMPASGLIEQAEAALRDEIERAFFRALVTETLRHRARLDHLLNGWLDRGDLASLPPPIRNALRLGCVQLLLMDRVPPHAAVDATVGVAAAHGHRGTAGLVNAVLRRAAREGRDRWIAIDEAAGETTAANLALRFSHPEWLVRRWLERWGPGRVPAILDWDNRHPDYWLRLRPGATPPEGATLGWIPGTARLGAGSRPASSPAFAAGEWTVQDGSGILAGWLCAPISGLVLDLCAAPGTKTGHLLERAEQGATIVALDLSPGRLRRMRRGLSRLGVVAHPIAADARRVPLRVPWNGVLLDAPCSNLGVLRRRVDLKWRAREEEIARLAAVQGRLLESAAAGAAPGAWLVYSVCTMEPEETERQRDRFFEANPGWRAAELPEWIPQVVRRREGEVLLVPGELETDGGYAFVARRIGAG
jgi:16S rRNA (cytosine967-C5)-methyltransferase